MKISYQPIGVIHTPFTDPKGMPIQPPGAAGVKGTVEVFEAFRPALKDLDGFSHVILLYHFHRARPFQPHVVPFLDSQPRGLFATRAPNRPNPIGLSVVRLLEIKGSTLHVEDIDILDGTPLLDIKPYVPGFDPQTDIKTGWLDQRARTAATTKSDDRFK
jgi:tRNA-Thr(GGU) m(6)t(6)A37 methyltransferase TsaA